MRDSRVDIILNFDIELPTVVERTMTTKLLYLIAKMEGVVVDDPTAFVDFLLGYLESFAVTK